MDEAVQQWEYRFVSCTWLDAPRHLDALGLEGWEVAGMSRGREYHYFVLKRPLR